MTREEAFQIMKRPVGGEWEYDWIRRFVELGMLKLDEPLTIKSRVETLLVGKKLATCSPKTMGAEIGLSDVDTICEALDAAGLKIVEKKP